MKIFKTAIVLTLVGILCGALIGFANYITAPIIEENKQKEAMKAYQGFFSDLEGIEEKELNEGTAYSVVEIIKDNKVIGYVFKAKGTNPRGLVDLAIAVDKDGEIVGVQILDTENTIGFYDQYIPVLDKISSSLGELDGVDIIGGVTQTGDLLNTLIKDIVKAAGDYIVLEDTRTIYEKMFGENDKVNKETLEGILYLIEEVELNGEVLGYIYYAKDENNRGFIDLAVGVDLAGTIKGAQMVEHKQTPSFAERYFDSLEDLKNKDIDSNLEIDVDAGATETNQLLNKLLDKILERANDDLTKRIYESVFGEYETVVLDETFEKTELVIKKVIVKDSDDKVIGYGYYLEGLTDKNIPGHDEPSLLRLLVGLDEDNNILGITTVKHEHTPFYYNKYEAEFLKLVGTKLEKDDNVDMVGGSTISGTLITKLVEALKEVVLP